MEKVNILAQQWEEVTGCSLEFVSSVWEGKLLRCSQRCWKEEQIVNISGQSKVRMCSPNCSLDSKSNVGQHLFGKNRWKRMERFTQITLSCCIRSAGLVHRIFGIPSVAYERRSWKRFASAECFRHTCVMLILFSLSLRLGMPAEKKEQEKETGF